MAASRFWSLWEKISQRYFWTFRWQFFWCPRRCDSNSSCNVSFVHLCYRQGGSVDWESSIKMVLIKAGIWIGRCGHQRDLSRAFQNLKAKGFLASYSESASNLFIHYGSTCQEEKTLSMTGFEPRRAGWAERNAATKLRKSHRVALTTDLELHWASELTGREIYNLQHSLVKTQIIWQAWWDSQWEWECALCSCENEKEWESVRERSFLSPVVFEGSTVTSSWMSFSEYVTF